MNFMFYSTFNITKLAPSTINDIPINIGAIIGLSIVKAPMAITTIARIIIKIERTFEICSPENRPAIPIKIIKNPMI